MTCPCCEAVVSVTPVAADVGVCPECARSVVIEGETMRVATAEDIRALTPSQVTALRQARPTAWRNDVRARHAAIVGGR